MVPMAFWLVFEAPWKVVCAIPLTPPLSLSPVSSDSTLWSVEPRLPLMGAVVAVPVLAKAVVVCGLTVGSVLATLEPDFVAVVVFDKPFADDETFTRLTVFALTFDLSVLFLLFKTQVLALTVAKCWSMLLELIDGYLWRRIVDSF